MSQLVETQRTMPTLTQYAHALLKAWPEATKEAAGVLYAQYGLETGAGKYCWNWNLGNVKHVNGDGFDYVALKGVFEYVNGQRVEVPQSSPSSWFRVYPDLDTAMVDHFAFLKKHYAPGWSAVIAGDVPGFAKKLHDAGYFTASEDSYAKGMMGYFALFTKSTAFEDAQQHIINETAPPATPDFDIVHAMPDFEPIAYNWDDTTTPSGSA